MNGKELLDKMSDVDPKLIEGAETQAEKPKSKRALFIGLSSGMAAVAAALAIIIGINASSARTGSVDNHAPVDSLTSLPATNAGTATESNSVDKGVSGNASEPTSIEAHASDGLDIKPEAVVDEAFAEYENLPKVSNKDFGVRGGGNWITQVGLYKVIELGEPVELESHSPWSIDAELTTLPVYLSNSTTPDVDKIRERVINTAAILGIPEDELEIKNRGLNGVGDLGSYREILEQQGLSEEEIEAELERVSRYSGAQSSIEGKSSNVTICCYTAGELVLWFKEPCPGLPDGCSLDKDATPEEMIAAAEYIAEEYKELLGFKNPKIARYYDGIDEYNYYVYEGEGDLEAQIINYRLNYASFVQDFETPNSLGILRRQTMDNLEKLGDYPVYTAQQALWVMSSDRVPEEVRIPEGAEIVKVELEYENYVGYTAVIPYYEFVVKTDEIDDYSGELIYRHYKIPAVPEQFLDMDIADYGVRA